MKIIFFDNNAKFGFINEGHDLLSFNGFVFFKNDIEFILNWEKSDLTNFRLPIFTDLIPDYFKVQPHELEKQYEFVSWNNQFWFCEKGTDKPKWWGGKDEFLFLEYCDFKEYSKEENFDYFDSLVPDHIKKPEDYKGFFMVFLNGGNGPTFRHTTFDSAKKEAERLAKIHGVAAYVLEAVNKVQCEYSFKNETILAIPDIKSIKPGGYLPF